MKRFIVVAVLLLAGCGSATGLDDVTGTYALVEAGGRTLPAPGIGDITIEQGSLVMASDGTFRLTTRIDGQASMGTGTYSESGGRIVLTTGAGDDWADAGMSGNRLTVEIRAAFASPIAPGKSLVYER
jgi:hypothetical protein